MPRRLIDKEFVLKHRYTQPTTTTTTTTTTITKKENRENVVKFHAFTHDKVLHV